ncbi:uncharacterized protein LOC134209288 [Armigeres subalbatus]|uniref:uncharacterized protein LOC134209288 n=1 Tax=Armigeres subalbatus TaxID=124917 RepID=UPI002ED12040
MSKPIMVSQNAEPQLHKFDTFEFRGRSSFSHHDLDYKMKMLQLTLVYRRSVIEDRPLPVNQPNRHSVAQETFAKAKTFAIGQPFHLPKILAVEPKLKPEVKPEEPKISKGDASSATLPSNPQHSKVQRLVRLFENTASTVPKNCAPSNEIRNKLSSSKRQPVSKPVIKEPCKEKELQEGEITKKAEKITPNDEEIRAELKQRRKDTDFP